MSPITNCPSLAAWTTSLILFVGLVVFSLSVSSRWRLIVLNFGFLSPSPSQLYSAARVNLVQGCVICGFSSRNRCLVYLDDGVSPPTLRPYKLAPVSSQMPMEGGNEGGGYDPEHLLVRCKGEGRTDKLCECHSLYLLHCCCRCVHMAVGQGKENTNRKFRSLNRAFQLATVVR